MNILFIGNFQTGPGGEPADETHLVRELGTHGNVVHAIPRDEWREYVLEGYPQNKYSVPTDGIWDIAIICKWHHFYDGRFIDAIREKYKCPVFYWVWDNMEGHTLGDWHMNMAQRADLYLSGELGLAKWYHDNGVKFYYFQFDSVDGLVPEYSSITSSIEKVYDVVYLGSCTNQNGRLDILKEINKEVKIQVFGHDYEQWRKEGFLASPAVYGADANEVILRSHIVLGTSAGQKIFGYWSNRVGRVLQVGGFLLQWFTPGMESVIADSCDYFSTAKEAISKIKFYLENPKEIERFLVANQADNRNRWTSSHKTMQLSILCDRYLKDPDKNLWMLP